MPACPHIRVGRVMVDERIAGELADIATIKRMYNEAVSVATDVWNSAQTEGKPDATIAKTDDRRPRPGRRPEPHRRCSR